jgi:hypothetical protein
MDIGPGIIATTGHSVMAGGYHRNDEAIRDVILAFMGTPEEARRYVEAHGIGLVAYCGGLPEIERYRARSPGGFMARLERGETPSWLEPVQVQGTSDLRVWRVKRAR